MVRIRARAVRSCGRGDGGDRPRALALTRFCLDTSAYSHFKRGDSAIVDLVDGAEWIGVPTVVIGELLTGFLAGHHAARNEQELAVFLSHPIVEEIPIDRAVARTYAEIVTTLRRRGAPLPTNDIWIAAAAARAGAILLTYDAHFRAIERVGSLVLEPPPTT